MIDLSIARRLEHAEISGPIGTDAYMAPEQCEPGTVCSATDVWGLGATLHHAVSGSKPFPGQERFPQLTQQPVPLGEDVPDGLRELIEGMLAFEPGDRPTAARWWRTWSRSSTHRRASSPSPGAAPGAAERDFSPGVRVAGMNPYEEDLDEARQVDLRGPGSPARRRAVTTTPRRP